MSNEKMAILKMLEDKKITADEAARLLQTIGSTGAPPVSEPKLIAPEYSPAFAGLPRPKPPELFVEPSKPLVPPVSHTEVPKLRIEPPKFADEPPRHNTMPTPAPASGYDPRAAYGGDPRMGADPRVAGAPGPAPIPGGSQRPTPVYGESFAEEMSRKLGGFMRDMEPKLHKFTESVVEKTVGAADAISRSMSASPMPASSPRPSAPGVARGGIEKMFELRVPEPGGELSLAGLNGSVLVRGYNGDKISAKLYYVPKRPNVHIELMALGRKFYLHYDENDFERVCIDAFVPERMFDNIRVSTVGGALTVSSLTVSNLKLEGMNGDTELTGLAANNLIVECNNGALRLRDVSAVRASIENFNGSISALNTDVEQMKLSTFNGGVSVQMGGFRNFNDYEWELDSSNAKMSLVLPSESALGYNIRAAAALGTVKLGLIGLSYTRNDRSFAEAQSIRFNEAAKKVRMNLSTSNAALEVN